MLDLINNTTKLLGDDLKREIKTGSRLRIAASCFSIYAYDALKEELESIEDLKFLFTTPTLIGEQIKDSVKNSSGSSISQNSLNLGCVGPSLRSV